MTGCECGEDYCSCECDLDDTIDEEGVENFLHKWCGNWRCSTAMNKLRICPDDHGSCPRCGEDLRDPDF
jgi:hypothetical protein